MGRERLLGSARYPRPMSFPRPDLWLDDVYAPGYRGRKRGEVVRTRTTLAQAHS